MKNGSRALLSVAAICLVCTARSQDDDHTITNVNGITYLAPNGVATSNVDGFTVGTTPNGNASLVVEGNQMDTPTGEVFRTIGPAGDATNWRLFRGTDQIGRIFANGGTNLGFNVMQREIVISYGSYLA